MNVLQSNMSDYFMVQSEKKELEDLRAKRLKEEKRNDAMIELDLTPAHKVKVSQQTLHKIPATDLAVLFSGQINMNSSPD